MRWRLFLLAAAASLAACGGPAGVAAEPGGRSEAELRMPGPRAAHAAVLLADGRILLIGGCVLESCEAGPASATVDAFDPRTGRFAAAGTLAERRVSAAAARLASGEIMVAGGWVGSSVSASVELFDPSTGRSRAVARLGDARADIASVTLRDGRVLLAGGYGDGRALGTVEIFDPQGGTIHAAGALLEPRAGGGAALLPDGRVLIVGGGVNGPTGLVPTGSAEIFDPATGRSVPAGRLAEPRYKQATVALADGSVLVLGGSDERDRRGKLASIERFDPAKSAFAPAGRMLEARFKIGAAAVLLSDGRVLIAGGGARAEIYDPTTRTSVATGPDFGRSLNFASASLLADGSVLVAGGYDENGIRMSDRAWILRPAPR